MITLECTYIDGLHILFPLRNPQPTSVAASK